jgi:hypothetical protein
MDQKHAKKAEPFLKSGKEHANKAKIDRELNKALQASIPTVSQVETVRKDRYKQVIHRDDSGKHPSFTQRSKLIGSKGMR